MHTICVSQCVASLISYICSCYCYFVVSLIPVCPFFQCIFVSVRCMCRREETTTTKRNEENY